MKQQIKGAKPEHIAELWEFCKQYQVRFHKADIPIQFCSVTTLQHEIERELLGKLVKKIVGRPSKPQAKQVKEGTSSN